MNTNTELRVLINSANTLLSPPQVQPPQGQPPQSAFQLNTPQEIQEAKDKTKRLLEEKITALVNVYQTKNEELEQAQADEKAIAQATQATQAKRAAGKAQKAKEALQTQADELAEIKKQIEKHKKFLQNFDELDTAQKIEVEIPYSADNPVKSVKYRIPGYDSDASSKINQPDSQFTLTRPSVCACDVEFENGLKMTFYPDKTTEVYYDKTHPNESVEALVDETVLRVKAHYEETGQIPEIRYELSGFKSDDVSKQVLEKHLFALTMQRMLVTPIQTGDQSLLSYVQKQDMVVEAFMKGGWNLDKIRKTEVGICSLFVSPNSKFDQDKYLNKVYGKENQTILENFKRGSIQTQGLKDLLNPKERSLTAGFRQHLLGVGSQWFGAPEREKIVHDYLKEYISTLGPGLEADDKASVDIKKLLSPDRAEPLPLPKSNNQNKRIEVSKKLGEQGVTPTQLSEVVTEIGKKLKNSLNTSLVKSDILKCNYLDLDQVGSFIDETQLKNMQQYGLSKAQVQSALANQVYNANEVLRAYLSTKTADEIKNITQNGFSADDLQNAPLKDLIDSGLTADALKAHIPNIQASNEFISEVGNYGLSMSMSARQDLVDRLIQTNDKRLPTDMNREQLLHLLDSRWNKAQELVSQLNMDSLKPLSQQGVNAVPPQAAAAAAAAQPNPLADFIANNNNNPQYKQLRALGLDDESIFRNAVYHHMTRDFIQKSSPDSAANIPVQDLEGFDQLGANDVDIVQAEIDSRLAQMFNHFRKLAPKPTPTNSFHERLNHQDANYNKLKSFGYNNDDIDKLNTIKNRAFNQLAKQLVKDPAPLKRGGSIVPLGNRAMIHNGPENFVTEMSRISTCQNAIKTLKSMGYSNAEIKKEANERHEKLKVYKNEVDNKPAVGQPASHSASGAQPLAPAANLQHNLEKIWGFDEQLVQETASQPSVSSNPSPNSSRSI